MAGHAIKVKERETERERETDRQIDRQTEADGRDCYSVRRKIGGKREKRLKNTC